MKWQKWEAKVLILQLAFLKWTFGIAVEEEPLGCPSEFIYGRYWKSPMQCFSRHMGFWTRDKIKQWANWHSYSGYGGKDGNGK